MKLSRQWSMRCDEYERFIANLARILSVGNDGEMITSDQGQQRTQEKEAGNYEKDTSTTSMA